MTEPETAETVSLHLLRQWHAGEQGALGQLIKRNLAWVQAYVHKHLRGALREQLETVDLVQDAMVQVLQHGPQFEVSDEEHFRCLLARIVTNDIQDQHRWFRRQRRDKMRERRFGSDSVLYLDGPAKSVTRPSQTVERDERAAWVRLGIEMLGAEDRQVLRMRQWEEASFAAIGAELGVSEDAARMRHNRALVRLGDKVIELRSGGIARFVSEQGLDGVEGPRAGSK